MKWTCRKFELFIDDYLEDELSVGDRFGYEAHLAACPRCQRYFDETSAFIEEVHELGRQRAHPGKMPQDLLDRFERLPIKKKRLLAQFAREALEEEDRAQEKRRRKRRQREKRALPN